MPVNTNSRRFQGLHLEPAASDQKMQSWVMIRIGIVTRVTRFYSVRKFSMGLVIAALIAWKLVVMTAMTKTAKPESIGTHH